MVNNLLNNAKTALLPKLRYHEDLDLEIFVDFEHNVLLVKGFNTKKKFGEGFVILASDIESNTHEAYFDKMLPQLVARLSGPRPEYTWDDHARMMVQKLPNATLSHT